MIFQSDCSVWVFKRWNLDCAICFVYNVIQLLLNSAIVARVCCFIFVVAAAVAGWCKLASFWLHLLLIIIIMMNASKSDVTLYKIIMVASKFGVLNFS